MPHKTGLTGKQSPHIMNKHCSLFNTQPASPPSALEINAFERVIVFIPHPDDESLGCGGLINQLHQQNTPILIVLVSDGSGAGELDESAAQERQKEFKSALNLLSPNASIEYWNLPDGSLNQVQDLSNKIKTSICQFSATDVIAPWLKDMHPDHAIVGESAYQAIQTIPMVKSILFYEVWTPVQTNCVLDITQNYPVKKAALQCHETALKCGAYQRAMYGLSSYRSLFTGHLAKEGHFAEAFYLHRNVIENRQGYTIEQADTTHQKGITALFAEIYGQAPPSQWWQWKYEPELLKGTVCKDSNGRLFAFYGNLTRKAHLAQTALWTSQIADVMVHPKFRTSVGKRGVFYKMSEVFIDPYIGETKALQLSFGFPHARALKLGVALKLYRYGDRLFNWSKQVNEASCKVSLKNKLFFSVNVITDKSPNHFLWVDRVFFQMKKALSHQLVLDRSAQYWYDRYFKYALKSYECLTLSAMCQRIVGGIVFLIHDDCLEIIDLVFTQKQYIPQLLNALQRHAIKLNLPLIKAWGTESFINDLPEGQQEHAGWIALPAPGICTKVTEKVINKCWFSAGDSDFK
ncbi:MAG: PIG-L family deacetylase [Thiomicrorhabdus sp.]|nr:PIG-L family deacetylase [Thiomicrorhabdus sp.]